MSNPHWGMNLVSHFGMAGVATRFANYENVSRTNDWFLILLRGLYRLWGPSLTLRDPPMGKYP